MEVWHNGTRPSRQGPEEWFTGTVRVDPVREAPAQVQAALVTFEPAARTAWHTHPAGQTLIVTSGKGLAQCWGGQLQELSPGDVIWFPAGEKHWHGAAPDSAMSHYAIQEAVGGKIVEWLEKVTDEQYKGT